MAKIHAYIISSLKADMPKFFRKSKKKKELIKNLPTLFKRVQEEHMVSASDIPPVATMQEKLKLCDFSKFPHLREKLIQTVDQMLDVDIADLMSIVPQDSEDTPISGGAFDDVKDTISPFGYQKCEGIDLGSGEPEWIVTKERSKWDAIFKELGPTNGKLTGTPKMGQRKKIEQICYYFSFLTRIHSQEGDDQIQAAKSSIGQSMAIGRRGWRWSFGFR